MTRDLADAALRRPIRSYVLRQGRISPAQRRACNDLLPRYGVAFEAKPLDYKRLFGRVAPVVLEIGFGMGETTAAIALRSEERRVGKECRGRGSAGGRG